MPPAPAPTQAPPAKPPAQLQKITFTLSWLPGGRYGFYYAAQEKGWYREQGLDVNVIRGLGGNDALTKIATGTAQLGEADMGPLTQAGPTPG